MNVSQADLQFWTQRKMPTWARNKLQTTPMILTLHYAINHRGGIKTLTEPANALAMLMMARRQNVEPLIRYMERMAEELKHVQARRSVWYRRWARNYRRQTPELIDINCKIQEYWRSG